MEAMRTSRRGSSAASPGIVAVVRIDGAIGVVADSFWRAQTAADLLVPLPAANA